MSYTIDWIVDKRVMFVRNYHLRSNNGGCV